MTDTAVPRKTHHARIMATPAVAAAAIVRRNMGRATATAAPAASATTGTTSHGTGSVTAPPPEGTGAAASTRSGEALELAAPSTAPESASFSGVLTAGTDGPRCDLPPPLGALGSVEHAARPAKRTPAAGHASLRGALEARWSPDGARVAYAVEDVECGVPCSRILVGSAGTSQVTEVGKGAEPVWSPDGRRLAYVAYGGVAAELTVVDVASGDTIMLGPATFPIAWSADGRIATAAHSETSGTMVIRILDVESGQLIAELPGEAPSWRPLADGH